MTQVIEAAKASWMESLLGWWHGLLGSDASDLEKTQVVDCQVKLLTETQVLRPQELELHHPERLTRDTVLHIGHKTVVCTDTKERAKDQTKQWTMTRLAEKRTSVRYPCNMEALCRPSDAPAEAGLKSRVKNVSRGGLGLMLGEKFESGTILVLDLQPRDPHPGRTLVVKVMHARPLTYRGWFLGCAFLQPLDESEVKALV